MKCLPLFSCRFLILACAVLVMRPGEAGAKPNERITHPRAVTPVAPKAPASFPPPLAIQQLNRSGFVTGSQPNAPTVAGANVVADLHLPGTSTVPGPPKILYVVAPPHESDKLAADGSLPLHWDEGSVSVYAPAEVYQAAIEKQMPGGRWQPVKTGLFGGAGGTITAALAVPVEQRGSYRARGFTWDKFDMRNSLPCLAATEPGSLFGTAIPLSSGMGIGIATPTFALGNLVTAAPAALTLSSTANATATTSGLTASTSPAAVTAPVETSLAAPVAVESDIWKFAGDRLFYFNQFRGLQVIDIHDPAHPAKLGTLRMPAVGDQMQVLDNAGRYLALFVRQSSNSWGTQVKIVAISEGGVPSVIRSIDLDGQLADTRLIGTRLYVLVSSYCLTLRGYDVSDPTHPVLLGQAVGSGYLPVLQDAGDYLLVAASTSNESQTMVHAIDISGDGTPRLVKSVILTGCMHDQFKMNVVGDAIVGVSQVHQRVENLTSKSTFNGDKVTVSYTYKVYPSQTWIETFSLAGTDSQPLAQLHLDDAEGETLYAARFDGRRLYVVTYGVKQTEPQVLDGSYTYTLIRLPVLVGYPVPSDPLFIIDLSDTANPVLHGQLEIPGYSTFIQPLGDRLLSVGREGDYVAASLFDVSDMDSPSLLSRVYPGKQEGWKSWSESETEHRAVTWLDSQNKFIVPYQNWSGTSYDSAAQEVNYTPSKLTLGDKVQTDAVARRGTSINGYFFAISGKELVVATDPAKASEASKEVASLELAWPVDRIAAVGDYLIEVESLEGASQDGNGWHWPLSPGSGCRSNQRVVLRLAARGDPETILDSAELAGDESTVLALSVHGGRLYLAQWVRLDAADVTAELRTYVIKPQGGKIRQVASATASIDVGELRKTAGVDFSNVQALWVNQDKLVWYIPCTQRSDDYAWSWPAGLNDNPSPEVVAARHRAAQGWGKAVCAVVCPVSVSADGISTPASSFTVEAAPAKDEVMLVSCGRAFADNGRLFFSSAQVVGGGYVEPDPAPGPGLGALTVIGISFTPFRSTDQTRTLLHVLDFNAPIIPDELRVTALPGPLLGASSADEQGAWLLCGGGNMGWYGESLLSLAYDGLTVWRKDEMSSYYINETNSDSRNGLLLSAMWSSVQAYRQNQKTGRLQQLDSWGNLDGVGSVRMVGKCAITQGWQSVKVARINDDQTFTPLAAQSWPGYGSALKPGRTVLDPQGAGAWVPVADYGVEWLDFGAEDSTVAAALRDD